MHEVKTAFGDRVFYNNNRKIKKLDPLHSMPESKTHHLLVQKSSTIGRSLDSQSNITRFILHRMQSKHSLSEIKMHRMWLILCRSTISMLTIIGGAKLIGIATNQLGFFYGIDPQFYDLDQAT
jgi:hypothetical protein